MPTGSVLLDKTHRKKLQVQEIENRSCTELYKSWTQVFQKNFFICFNENSLKIKQVVCSLVSIPGQEKLGTRSCRAPAVHLK